MKLPIRHLCIVLCIAPTLAWSDLRELSQAELRQAVYQNGVIETRRLISGVENHTGGDVVEVRAFADGGAVTYRVLVRHDDGRLGAIMVDGKSGYAVTAQSAVGNKISALAASANAAAAPSNRNTANRSTQNRNRAGNDTRGSNNGASNSNRGNGNRGNSNGARNGNRSGGDNASNGNRGNGNGASNGNRGNGRGNSNAGRNNNNGNGNGGGNRGNGRGNGGPNGRGNK